MIENGLYLMTVNAMDGAEGGGGGGGGGVVILRDGKLLGGDSYFYLVGTYSCFKGKWKGEITTQEHTKAPIGRPMANRIVSSGFSGTYSKSGAEASATALVGKRSILYDFTLSRLD